MQRLIFAVLMLVFLPGCTQGYGTHQGKHVWYDDWNAGGGERPMRVMDDVEGNLVILNDHRYAKTENSVYLLGIKIHDADPDTFTILEYPFSKDKKHVYCGTMYLIDADPNGFKLLLQEPTFGMLIRSDKEPFIEEYGDHPAFQHEKYYCTKPAWSTDGRHIYYAYAKVVDANPGTFTPLNGLYGKDDKTVFFGRNVLSGADHNTFVIDKNGRARDKGHIFIKGKLANAAQLKAMSE